MNSQTKFDDPPRHKPYIWPSWFTKLLSGEDHCWWRAWTKTNYKVTKLPETKDRKDFFREYTEKHDAITVRRAEELRQLGCTVYVEDEAQFKMVGSAADVAGKPDIAAVRDRTLLVVDAKSGKKRSSDHYQVLIYMFALPLTWLRDKVDEVKGEVEYTDGPVPVRPLGPVEKDQILEAIKKLTGSEPDPIPSVWECKYCDVAKCPVRYKSNTEGNVSEYF